jgi:TRAP-type C4-dicarboxylate transport system permease small subunit
VTEKKDDAAPEEADVPPTRKHEVVTNEPPARASAMSLANMQPGFPDDGPISGLVRAIDTYVGHIELAVLLVVFTAVVIVASASALSEHIGHHQIGLWWTWVVRKGTFAIALLGAAYATQQQRLLAMDLVSRRLSPRGRLMLGIVLKLFTIALAAVLVYIGMFMHKSADHDAGPRLHLWLFDLTEKDALMVIPTGAALIVLHSLLHAVIEADYLVRGKQLPERARSGH